MTLAQIQAKPEFKNVIAIGAPNDDGVFPVMTPGGDSAGNTVMWVKMEVSPRTGAVRCNKVEGASVHFKVDGEELQITDGEQHAQDDAAARRPDIRQASELGGLPQPKYFSSTRIVAQSASTNPKFQEKLAELGAGSTLDAAAVRKLNRGFGMLASGFGATIESAEVIPVSGGLSLRFKYAFAGEPAAAVAKDPALASSPLRAAADVNPPAAAPAAVAPAAIEPPKSDEKDKEKDKPPASANVGAATGAGVIAPQADGPKVKVQVTKESPEGTPVDEKDVEKQFGMPQANAKKFQEVATRFKVTIEVRPTNPESVELLKDGPRTPSPRRSSPRPSSRSTHSSGRARRTSARSASSRHFSRRSSAAT